MATRQQFTVTGPDLDKTAESAALGLSRAITAGNKAAVQQHEATFYVRDPSGEVVGRVVSDGSGAVDIHGPKFFRAGGRAQDAPTAPLQQAGRPAVGHHDSANNHNGKEHDMSTEVKPDPKAKAHTKGPKKEVGGTASTKTKAAAPAAAKAKAAAKPKASTDGKAKKVPAKQAAVDVLKKAGGPLHISKIVEGVLATDGVKLGGKTPNATIAAMFAVEAKKSDGIFVKTDKATYGLRDA